MRLRPAAAIAAREVAIPCAALAIATLLALLSLALVPQARAGARPSLKSVNEYGTLKMQSSKGSTIDEQGSGSGSFSCTVKIELTLSGTLVTASYLAHPHGGSIRGTASARIHSASTVAAIFSGTITLQGGTGSYAHASGTATFDGTINRTSYAMSLHITGKVRL
jgi:hypothetical protein